MPQLAYFKFWFAVGWGLAFTVVYLSLSSAPQLPDVRYADKFGHLLAYGALTGWFGQLYTSLKIQWRIFIGFTLMGIALEFLQAANPGRTFDVLDMIANTTGAGVGWWLTRNWFSGTLMNIEKVVGIRRK